jgi:hypothetical protein
VPTQLPRVCADVVEGVLDSLAVPDLRIHQFPQLKWKRGLELARVLTAHNHSNIEAGDVMLPVKSGTFGL